MSFGRDTKDVSTESGNKIGSSRRSSFESPGNRSRASDSTPGSVRSNRSGISTPGSDDFNEELRRLMRRIWKVKRKKKQ